MSRLVSLTVDQIREMSISEILTSLEILKIRIGSGKKGSKPTKDLEKTFSVEKKNIFRDRIKKKIYKIFNLFIVILNIIMCSDE